MPEGIREQIEHIGESSAAANHDYDLVHELSKRLNGVWRYDQYIANADGNPGLQNFWRSLKKQDLENVEQLKALIKQEIEKGCF